MLFSSVSLSFAPQLVSRPCVSSSCVTMSAGDSYLSKVPMGPPDAILGIAEAFKASTAPGKVNVAIGAYRDAQGSPWVLPAVRAAEAKLLERGENKEYAGIVGLPGFNEVSMRSAIPTPDPSPGPSPGPSPDPSPKVNPDAIPHPHQVAMRFAYGADCAALDEGRIAVTQTLSGTAACRSTPTPTPEPPPLNLSLSLSLSRTRTRKPTPEQAPAPAASPASSTSATCLRAPPCTCPTRPGATTWPSCRRADEGGT